MLAMLSVAKGPIIAVITINGGQHSVTSLIYNNFNGGGLETKIMIFYETPN